MQQIHAMTVHCSSYSCTRKEILEKTHGYAVILFGSIFPLQSARVYTERRKTQRDIKMVEGGLEPNKTTKSVGIFPLYVLSTLLYILHNSLFFFWGGGVRAIVTQILISIYCMLESILVHNLSRSTEYTL